MSLNDRIDDLIRLDEGRPEEEKKIEREIDNKITVLVEQAVHCDSEATKLILIRCIAHLHQAKRPNIMGVQLPFEYSLEWAKGCVWLANERM